jgi:integrase/recombinase XerD
MSTHTTVINHRKCEPDLGVFDNYRIQFRQYLSERNYAESTIGSYLRCISGLVEFMKVEGLTFGDLDESQAVGIVAKTGWIQRRKIYATFMVSRFVLFLAERGVGKPALPPTAKEIARTELRRDYSNYLRCQRGLSERTIFHSWRIADRFLGFRFRNEIGDLSQIRASDIVKFLQQLVTRKPPLRDKTLSSHLRNFFRYLFKIGKTTSNLAIGVPMVAQRYGTRLPRHLTTEQVDILVRAVRTDTAGGRRNYAMVMLLARLGLRATEVTAMQLDDIDWRSGEVIVRGKGNRHDRVPLPPDVGEALADYIKSDRKTASRVLFVTERAPHRPFKDGQVLNLILRGAFARTGLKPPAPYVGSHILRHSLARNLVQRGASLEEIGDMLRHRSRASTMLYAKLDIAGLRSIAQPWPVAGGAK